MRFAVILILALSVQGCSAGYIMRGAYEEAKLILTREKIETLLKDPTIDENLRNKLSLVLEAREFAIRQGLDPGKSFTRYAKLDRDVFAWVVMGSRPHAFELKTWWFPIVGSVPYKGFFEEDDAKGEAKGLESDGYETWVRGTEAMSTLGWFIDPVLSTTLSNDDVEIVNTIIHESVHSTIWIKHSVDFNESLANFVGLTGTVNFYREKLSGCSPSDLSCIERYKVRVNEAGSQYARTFEFSKVLNGLYTELSKLYSSGLSKDDILAKREEAFKEALRPIEDRYSDRKVLISPNNAEIMQLKIYMTELPTFEAVYIASGGSLETFMSVMRSIGSEEGEPFELLKGKLHVR